MKENFLLPGMPEHNTGSNGLFLAIFPSEETKERIADLAAEVKRKHGLKAQPLLRNRLHLTVCDFNHLHDAEERIVRSVANACEIAAAATRPFEIELNRVMSFNGGEHKQLVLESSSEMNELQAFRKFLSNELVKQRCRPNNGSGNKPHVTLLYDQEIVKAEEVEPVCWTATEIVLVKSHAGQTRYETMGAWAFGG